VAHLKRAKYEAAVAAFTEAINIDPKTPNAYVGRALAHRSLGNEAAAIHDEQTVQDLGGVKPPRIDNILLLHPDFQIDQRVNKRAFTNYFLAVDGATKTHFQHFPQAFGLDILVACALVPSDKLLVDIQVRPENVPAEIIAALWQRIVAIPRPPTRLGPVAFASRSVIQGGCSGPDPSFNFPFASIMKPGRQGLLDDVLMEAAGSSVPGQSWWQQFKRSLGFRS